MNDQDKFAAGSMDYTDEAFFTSSGADDESGQMLEKFKSLLRGRVHWAVILAVVLGAAAATAGFFSQKPQFRTEAQFMFHPYIVSVEQTHSTGIPPMFQEYLNAQTALLLGPEVERRAVESEIWQTALLTTGHSGGFGKEFGVGRARNSYVFSVYNSHEDAQVAAASVNAVVQAYIEVFRDREQQTDSGLLNRLIARRMTLEREVAQLVERRAAVSDTMTPVELQMLFERKIAERDRISRMLSDAQLRLQLLRGDGSKKPEDMSISEIAQVYPKVAELMKQREQIARQIEILRIDGKLDQHPRMRASLRTLEGLDRLIADTVNEYRLVGSVDIDRGAGDVVFQEIELLQAQTDQLTRLYDTLNAETSGLMLYVQRIRAFDREIEGKEGELAGLEQRIDVMMQNRPIGGRIEVIREAMAPSSPTNLKKRIQLAVMGLMGGAGMGVGIVLLVGLLDRHLRHAGEARMGLPDVRMLGMLPTLPEELEDPEQAELTANSVHHIRTMLQLGGETGSRVLSVTSATAGSGKSSLTVALGLSFSVSGSRTLLIDCDVVGGGLTRRLLGESHGESGVLDVCAGKSINQCVVQVNDSLDLLPLGQAGPRDAGALAPRAIRSMIAQSRERYDVVIIDTGPVLGSLEASLVAPEADAVVMIICRGDQKTVVNRSAEHIRSLGATIAGVVFNHALETDLTDASYGSFVSQSRSMPGQLRRPSTATMRETARFGPLGSAVATFAAPAPAQHNGERRSGAA